MQSDKNSMVEKILRDIESVISRDEFLEEFFIIPVSLNQNKSPVVHEEHNLGLESWCVKHVYSYAYQRALEARKPVAKRKLLHEEYNNVNRLILGVLLINPDVSTLWNMRRELVSDRLLSIQHELQIAKIILSHKSKSNEAFSYRKWLLRRILSSEIFNKSSICSLLNEEFRVCNTTAQKSPNNYHSWCHRIWCVENILKIACDEIRQDVLLSELNYTEGWVTKHVSEHTGFHYRQYIINCLKNIDITLDDKYDNCVKQYFKCSSVKKPVELLGSVFGLSERVLSEFEYRLMYKHLAVLLFDLSLNQELHEVFPEHEALWCHRRYILHQLFALLFVYFGVNADAAVNLDLVLTSDKREWNVVEKVFVQSMAHHRLKDGEKCPKMFKCEKNPIHSSKLCRLLLGNEQALIEKCSKCNNRHGYLAQRHEKWLIYILGVSNV